MRKIISKIAGTLLGLSLAIGVGTLVSKHVSFEAQSASGDSYSFATAANTSGTSTDGAWSFATGKNSGTDPAWNAGSNELRIYVNGWIQFTGAANVTLESASFTIKSNQGGSGSGKAYPTGWSVDNGTISSYAGSNTSASVTNINASSFKISVAGAKGNVGFKTVTMTYSISGGELTTYTITYDANGGTGEMADTTGATPSVASCSFTAPEGKIFSSWNTEDDCSGDEYSVGDTVSNNVDLYAIWVDKPACVTLDKIGTSLATTANTEEATVDILDGSDTYTLNYYQCKKQGDSMFMTKDVNPYISNSTEMPGVITSIEVFTNSGSSGKVSYDVAFGTSEFHEATSGVGAVVIGVGTSHVYENESVEGATYFCITIGNSNNGQVLKIVINYEHGETPDPAKKDMVIKQGGVAADGIELVYSSSSYAFKAFEESTELSDITWSVSDQTVATISAAGSLSCVEPGSVVVYAEKEGYNKASASITITKGSVSTVVVSGSMTKTDYYVGDEWSNAGLTVTANYSSGLNEDVTSSAAWSYNPAAPALNVESVVATATFGGKSGSSSAQSVSVTRANPIQALYSKAKGASTGEFYGYYVGFATGSGPIVMDGAYGIMLFNASQDVSSWTEGETILHITAGTIDIYNGLYEVKSYTVETVSSADVAKPIVHTTTGSESATDANRLTNATGVVAAAPTKGSFTGNPAASDIQFTFTVGSNTFTVFYKKAAQTSEVMAALADSLENHTEITLNGFTSWYNNFQITMIGLVEAVESYTAENFAQDLLDQTDAVCAGYKDGDNNHDALEEIWSDLASKDKYPSLPTEQKNILADADRDESGSVVEQAMARYDYLTGKYNLSNFINGRTPVAFAPNDVYYGDTVNNNSSTIIIVVVALTSITSIGVLLVIKRKRSLVK